MSDLVIGRIALGQLVSLLRSRQMTTVPPFFIVGFQRSGTTLLRLMLDNHPEVAIPLDVGGLWAEYEARQAEFGDLSTEAAARSLIEALLKEERIRLWQVPFTAHGVHAHRTRPGLAGVMEAFYRAYAEAKGKRYWGDKDPGNMTRIDRIHCWFPEAGFLHIIRDGRDACLSHLEQSFGIHDVLDCAHAWREEVEWVRRLGRMLGPARYFELRYEDLVEDPEAELREVCAFLGLRYRPAMLEYHRRVGESVPEEKRHIWPKLDRPPTGENVGRWKRAMSASLRIAFEKRAGRTLRELGYETLPHPPRGGWLAEGRSVARRVVRGLRRRLGDRRSARSASGAPRGSDGPAPADFPPREPSV